MEEMKMTLKIIPAALFAAMITPPAMACTDWQAIAAFDAIIVANDRTDKNEACPGGKHENSFICGSAGQSLEYHMSNVVEDRKSTLVDKCRENVR
jgi:hypothetical protein